MQITFRINADSEAVFAPATLKALREMGDIIALDWLLDVICHTQSLYEELHDKVFASSFTPAVGQPVNETPF